MANFVITSQSTPDYDDWGWDDYWSCADWITWHKAMVKDFGKDYANTKLIKAYHQNAVLAHHVSCRSVNAAFKDYAKKNGFYDQLFTGLEGVVVKGGAALVNVADSALNVTDSLADNAEDVAKSSLTITKYLLPIILVLVIIGALLYLNKQFSIIGH